MLSVTFTEFPREHKTNLFFYIKSVQIFSLLFVMNLILNLLTDVCNHNKQNMYTSIKVHRNQ